MPGTKRVAQFIQRLAYENFIRHDEQDVRPADEEALARMMPESTPSYPAWSATSFSSYVPFRGPHNG
jgi:hypothetical protein